MREGLIYFSYLLLSFTAIGALAVARRVHGRPPAQWLTLALFAAPMIWLLWTCSEPRKQFSDLHKAYLPAARALMTDARELKPLYKRVDYVNIPIVAVAYIPFAAMTPETGQVAYTAVGVFGIGLAIYLLASLAGLRGGRLLALAALFAANGPLFNSLREGNSTHLVLLLLIGALACQWRRREIWTGLLLAIAVWIKLPLALFGLYYLAQRRWRIFFSFVASTLAIGGLSVAIYGSSLHRLWFERCILVFLGKPIAAFNVQSVDGFLARMFDATHLYLWDPVEMDWRYKGIRLALLLGLYGATAFVLWRATRATVPQSIGSNAPQPASGTESIEKRQRADALEFCIILTLAILTSPISWSHYYLLLLLSFAFFLRGEWSWRGSTAETKLAALGIALASLPVILAHSDVPWIQGLIARVWASHFFFGGLLLWGALLLARLRSGVRDST